MAAVTVEELKARVERIKAIKAEFQPRIETASVVGRWGLRYRRWRKIERLVRPLANSGVAWFDHKREAFVDKPVGFFENWNELRRTHEPLPAKKAPSEGDRILAAYLNTGRYFDPETGVLTSPSGKYIN